MAIQILDSSGSNKLTVDSQGSAKTTTYHPNITGNGAYRFSVQSGLLTAVAAASATAGHLFSARWGSVSKYAVITNLAIRYDVITGFTTAQELGIDAILSRSFSVAHTGGTALTLTGNSFKKRAAHSTTNFSDIRIGTTGALTAGTHTLDPHPILTKSATQLAAAATVANASFFVSFNPAELAQHPIILSQNEGIIVRNLITMGVAGTARLSIEMDWLEVDAY